MSRPEILAPAGNREMLGAAVFSGADAVYLGLTGFNARRTAGNFTPEELREAVVEEIITRQPYDAPKFTLDPAVTDFYAFTKDSVRLEGYQAHPLDAKIPVAV